MLTVQNLDTVHGGRQRDLRESDLATTLILAIFGLTMSIAILTPYVRHQTNGESFWTGEMIGP